MESARSGLPLAVEPPAGDPHLLCAHNKNKSVRSKPCTCEDVLAELAEEASLENPTEDCNCGDVLAAFEEGIVGAGGVPAEEPLGLPSDAAQTRASDLAGCPR